MAELVKPSSNSTEEVESAIAALISLAKLEHYNCELDTWYGCPLSVDGCSQDIPKVCNCGADEHNRKVDEVAAKLNKAGRNPC